jgi:hypothetical protein
MPSSSPPQAPVRSSVFGSNFRARLTHGAASAIDGDGFAAPVDGAAETAAGAADEPAPGAAVAGTVVVNWLDAQAATSRHAPRIATRCLAFIGQALPDLPR